MKPIVLLIGPTGYVGKAFCKHLSKSGVSFVAMSGIREHGYGEARLRFMFRYYPSIKVVINCGGYVGKPNVDACERDKPSCMYANAILPAKMAKVCHEYGVGFAHVGSGCIYSGGPHSESSTPNFSGSWYSYTKLMSERLLDLDNVWIWRIRMPFDGNFASKEKRCLLAKLASYSRIVEATNSLTYLPDFVKNAWECIQNDLPKGIWNMVHPDPINNSEIIEMISRHGLCGSKEIIGVREFESFVETPRSFCVLDSSKAASFGIGFRPVREALELALTIAEN